MNWKKRKEKKILLDQYNIKFPASFYNAFFILFDEMEDEEEILGFLEKVNTLMERRKGSSYIITFQEIIYLRRLNTYIQEDQSYPKNCHHVIPTSRIKDESKYRKEKVRLPVMFHEAWHICFANLYGKEVIYLMSKFFKKLTQTRKEMFYSYLSEFQNRVKEKIH